MDNSDLMQNEYLKWLQCNSLNEKRLLIYFLEQRPKLCLFYHQKKIPEKYTFSILSEYFEKYEDVFKNDGPKYLTNFEFYMYLIIDQTCLFCLKRSWYDKTRATYRVKIQILYLCKSSSAITRPLMPALMPMDKNIYTYVH